MDNPTDIMKMSPEQRTELVRAYDQRAVDKMLRFTDVVSLSECFQEVGFSADKMVSILVGIATDPEAKPGDRIRAMQVLDKKIVAALQAAGLLADVVKREVSTIQQDGTAVTTTKAATIIGLRTSTLISKGKNNVEQPGGKLTGVHQPPERNEFISGIAEQESPPEPDRGGDGDKASGDSGGIDPDSQAASGETATVSTDEGDGERSPLLDPSRSEGPETSSPSDSSSSPTGGAPIGAYPPIDFRARDRTPIATGAPSSEPIAPDLSGNRGPGYYTEDGDDSGRGGGEGEEGGVRQGYGGSNRGGEEGSGSPETPDEAARKQKASFRVHLPSDIDLEP